MQDGGDPFLGAAGGRKGRIPHRSYPDDLPKFLGKGRPGNFEPKESGAEKGGPGEMGHPHSLKVRDLSLTKNFYTSYVIL